jgi:TonB-linked SusC/RagA family outer membrane protein
MKKFLPLCLAVVFALAITAVHAQEQTITGKVNSAEDGSALPGVNVVLKGTTQGTTTSVDGSYTLVVPTDGVLVFSFIGFKTLEVAVGSRVIIDIKLEVDVTQLSEIVVTGVGDATDTRKLSVSVAKIDEKLIQQVPAVDVASILSGKIAGARVVSSGGAPGTAPSIVLRGNKSLVGGQNPLVIIDGVFSEGSAADINGLDIANIEVVKGAAAASIYGSRAANGVINITTKRGNKLSEGETRVVVRNEFGQNFLPKSLPINRSHNRIVGPGETLDLSVHQTVKPDQISDVPYSPIYDYQEDAFSAGSFYTNYVSIGSNGAKTSYNASFENLKQSGIVDLSDGFSRQNVRFNVDNKAFNDKLNFSLSSFYSTSKNDLVGPNQNGGDGSVLFNMLRLPPNSDLFALNEENGQPYNWDADPTSSNEVNPLYDIYMQAITSRRKRFMTSVTTTYRFTDWLRAEVSYALDNISTDYSRFVPNDYEAGPATSSLRVGQLNLSNSERQTSTLKGDLFANKSFGELNMTARVSYYLERNKGFGSGLNGNNFPIMGLPIADGLVQTDDYPFTINSFIDEINAESYFGVLAFTYKDRYIFDGLVRREQVSTFGADERWATFFRASGAWRISEDIKIPGVNELKLRASYGTAGNRPPVWDAQYETYTTRGFKATLGNKNLRREIAEETEIGLNATILDRVTLEINYAHVNLSDLIVNTPLVSPLGAGFTSQWRNVGKMENKVLEISLGVDIVSNQNFSWNVGVVFDRIRNKVTELDGVTFIRTGPSPNSEAGKGLIYVKEGGVLGEIWGNKLMTSLAELRPSDNVADYVINSDGYVVRAGEIGTVNEKPLPVLAANGSPLYAKIGDVNPDFNMGFNTTFSWKGLTIFGVIDWKQGGDVYNATKQWMFFMDRHGDQDQGGKAQADKKPFAYYGTGIYNANNPTDYFVEDGSYIKFRELNISYTLNEATLTKIGLNKLFNKIQLGAVGRNLGMITGYSGYDPEVSRSNPSATDAPNIYAYDGFTYPNMRTFSGFLTLTF